MLQKITPQIAVFSFAYSPFEGGAEIALREITKRLKAFNFIIFTHKFERDWLSRETRENAEIIRIGKGKKNKNKYGRIFSKIGYIFSAWQEAERMYRNKRFNAIWAIMLSYGGIAALFFKLRHPKIPFLLTVQEGDSESHLRFGKAGLIGIFGKWIIKKADYIQVISSYLKEFIRKLGAKSPIEVVPNGVDLALFNTQYKSFELKAVRENLGIADDYVIATVSRLVHKNGIDILIEAIASVKEKRPNVKCLIIGGGPEYKKLKVKSQKLKVDNNVIFLGQIPHKDLPLYLKISDVFVRPSRSEGLGNSFLEAMAVGIPVIGTSVGGIVDFLQDKKTGFCAAVDNPRDLAVTIKYVLENREVVELIVANAKSLIKQHYSWDGIAYSFGNIFSKLMNL